MSASDVPPPSTTTGAPAAVPPGAAPPSAALPAAPPPRRRSPWLTVLLCLAIFLGGGVVGAGVTVIHLVRTARAALLHPEQAPERIARRMQKRLDLSDDQTARIETILRRRQVQLLKARAEMLDRAGPELDGLEADVAGALSPGQAARWREQFRRLRGDWLQGAATLAPELRDR